MIDLTVKTLDSQNHAFSLEDDQITVRGFKEYIAESVAVPADSQRLIYCGRVLQDEKKLNDYDVNGKVIHLVQRAPPQPGQRGNDGGQSQGQNAGPHAWQHPPRTHYRLTRAQMHGNAMYFGAMSLPAEIVEGQGLPVPQLSNRLSNGRLVVARRMLDRANELMDRLDDPTCPLNPPSSENNQPPLAQQIPVQELEAEHYNNEGRTNGGSRLAEAAAAAIAAALSAAGANNVTLLRGNSEENTETGPATETSTSDAQSDAQQPQQSQSDQPMFASNSEGQSSRRATPQLPRPPQMAELLERLLNTQDRLRPYIERYRVLMHADSSLPPGAAPEDVEENQRIVDGVSESLHNMSHACHALSDIIVDMSQQPPRNLRCRPIIIQHSAILQPSIPIQVEAHISLHGRNANNNNGNEENGDSANPVTPPETNDGATEDTNQQDTEGSTQQQTEQQQQQQQEQTQSPFGTVFNLPNNVEVLMEVSPESNIDTALGSEQTQSGENNNNNNTNNNNNNGGRTAGGTSGAFPWGSAAPSDFVRNLMQAVAGHMVQGGITTTTITTRNMPTVGGQQTNSSMDSGNTNAGQSTQARSNVGTHPTTATQTRSTPRPHVFHQQTHPLGVGMSIGQGLDFDPFLPCNSYHIRRTSSTASRSSQTSTTEAPPQTQTATTSSATSNTSSTNTTASTTSQPSTNNSFRQLLHQRFGSTLASLGLPSASSYPDLGETFGNVLQMHSGGNIPAGVVGDRIPTLADFLESRGITMDRFTSQDSASEGNFLTNLSVLVVQNMTIEGVMRLRVGQWEPISHLRRPLQEFFQLAFPNTAPEALQEQAVERLLTELRPHLQYFLASEEDTSNRSILRVDICATVEALLRPRIEDILDLLFDNEVDDARFGRDTFHTVYNLNLYLCAVLRHIIGDGQAGLEAFAVSRFSIFLGEMECIHPLLCPWIVNVFIVYLRNYLMRVPQVPATEIIPLLIYRDVPSQTFSMHSSPIQQTSQTQSEAELMETEAVEERTSNVEASVPDDGEEIPESFPGHEALPSDWVPIIARDGLRQRRQLQMQGVTNCGMATFSDAYLGTLPTKRRKLIEQQKPRLLVSPTPNHSAITASMERLVREGVTRAGVEEVEGAAVAVAVDPGVRRAFGQAIRDCLNPHRYESSDFPDPLRFPNATKYFADQQDRPPKQ